MLDNGHEAMFPPKGNCSIWRYTDLTKLLSLLESRKLFFPRSDQFDDPYEGAYSRAGVEQLRAWAVTSGFEEVVETTIRNLPRYRESMFVSCWNAAEHESAAMWRLYVQGPEGVAIRTDHERLCAVLERSPLMIRTSMVRYVDYDKVAIPTDNGFYPFLHKRVSFAHESELRAIIWAWETQNQKQIPPGSTLIGVDMDPAELIQSVHVSPLAPQWFGELVEHLLLRYGLNVAVIRSTLYDRPAY